VLQLIKLLYYSLFFLTCTTLNTHTYGRNCLSQQVIEGKIKGGIEVTGRRGRRRSKLLDDFHLKWQEDEEGDVVSYWMTFIWRRKLWIALCVELALEEALDLS